MLLALQSAKLLQSSRYVKFEYPTIYHAATKTESMGAIASSPA